MSRNRYAISLIVALVLAFGGLAAVVGTGTSPALGLDLEGGVSVIMRATGEGAEEEGVLDQTVSVIRQRIDALGVAEPDVASTGDGNVIVQLPGIKNEAKALELIGTTAQLTFREVVRDFSAAGRRAPEITEERGPEVTDETVVYPDRDTPSILYRLAPAELTGDVVGDAQAIIDPGGAWVVSLDMNDEGADRWAGFTSEQACQRDQGRDDRIAIVLDGEVVSAPGMSPSVECGTGIAGGQSQIQTGGEEEAKDLALVLRFGSLPITLERQSVQQVSPTLGRDSLDAGLRAGVLGLALVMLYMVLFYRALGVVVWLGLAVFSAALYALLSILGETAGLTLSLAGVAGIIVSIGITTDSYIVAFERLKDEARSQKSITGVVERGMARAFRTILIADFVTASAAGILFMLAVGPVRGFALTLGLATLIDVVVAFFFTRSAVHLLAGTKFFTRLRFLGVRHALGVGS